MLVEAADERTTTRRVGAAIGAATGPVAAFGQAWAGTGDGRWHVWLLAIVVGALLGALTYPMFFAPSQGDASEPGDQLAPSILGAPFAALFGFAVGLVAGAFVAFPMGAVMGGLGGLLAGPLVVIATRTLGARAGGWGLALASLGAALVTLGVARIWL